VTGKSVSHNNTESEREKLKAFEGWSGWFAAAHLPRITVLELLSE